MRFSKRRQSDRAQDESPPPDPNGSTTVLQPLPHSEAEAEVLRAMADDWRGGAGHGAEVWLARHPQLSADREAAVRIVYEEICLREERGEQVPSAEIYRRFPEWKAELEVLFDCHRLIDPAGAAPNFPEAGQRLGELELIRKLGRGAVGQVFLATQPSLSDRLLVVKLTPRSGAEHLSLARLQHTHIAPLYLVQDFPEENLRALCMPYLGGASWSSLLHALRVTQPTSRSGRQIVELLAAANPGTPAAPDYAGPALRFLSRATYVQAVCWIGSCLADALHYAHQCGLVHLDIKPSNVLVAGDGQPMLLDFHLAREVVAAGADPPEQLGGTRGYMSPEQDLAAQAVRDGLPVPQSLDGRSDIYSLGVLLYESLTGKLPAADETSSRGDFRRLQTAGRGLEDLVHKCLAREPALRYREAGELSADLRRHLADLPLQGVPNRSPLERLRKWRRRKPYASALLTTVFVAVATSAALGYVFDRERVRTARLALNEARQEFDSRDYQSAIDRLETGSLAIGWVPGHDDLKQAIKTQLARSKEARLAGALHEVLDQLRFVDSLDHAPLARLRELEAGCSRLWDARAKLILAAPESATLRGSIQAADLVDLAALWAELKVRLAPRERLASARREALAILDQAEALCGNSLDIDLARLECADPAERGAASAQSLPAAKTAREHHVVGRYLFRGGNYEQAAVEFARAVELEPDAFWPNFYGTLCAYRRERFDEALNGAFVCVALAPNRPECFYNRALCQQAVKHDAQAIGDFTRALALDPQFGLASLGRGILRAQDGDGEAAIADFSAALAHGADPVATHYQMALVYYARKDRAAALDSLRQVFSRQEDYPPAVALKKAIDERP
jgi:eukaryotic-like serine/threonine-protein kinase